MIEAGTGARWVFDLKQYETVSTSTTFRYYASSVIYPTGEVITFSYDTAPDGDRTFYRPTRVSTNLGYYLTISYHSPTLFTAGWTAPNVVTLYSSAAPTTPLGSLTYSADGTSITDLAGRIYNCQGCNNKVGAETEVYSGSLRLPGETAVSVQVSLMFFDAAQRGVDSFYKQWRDGMGRSCRGMSDNAEKGSVDGMPALRASLSCPKNPRTGKPENLEVTLVQGHANMMMVQVAFRRAMTPTDNALIERVAGSMKVCDQRTLSTCSARAATGFLPVKSRL